MAKKKRLLDEYRFPGFRPRAEIKGIFGKPEARVIQLERTQKKQSVGVAERFSEVTTTRRNALSGIFPVERWIYTFRWKFGGCDVGSVGQ